MSNTRNTVRQVVYSSILVSIGLTGCAGNLTEDERFEDQYAAVERKEQIRSYIDSCEAADRVVLYTGPSTHRLRDPIKTIPNHARKSDYACGSSRELERMQAEMGIR